MRVLITGHRGYIGSVVACVLRRRLFDVAGLDIDLFAGCDFGRTREEVPSFDIDIRDVQFADLVSFDAVIHLAGLADDATGDLDSSSTYEINCDAAVRLAESCKQAGVARFVFASTCSVYGRAGSTVSDEDSPTEPLTPYARAKLAAEEAILGMHDANFVPVILRLATVYGVSPRLRLDLVVNDLVASAVTTNRVVLNSSGAAWRPLVHVEDVSRVCSAVLTAPQEAVAGRVFNVVPPGENHRVIDIADAVIETVPQSSRTVAGHLVDARSYRVSGDSLREAIPKFSFRWQLGSGIRQLASAFASARLTYADWRGDRYRRALRLCSQMDRGDLSADLRPALAETSST